MTALSGKHAAKFAQVHSELSLKCPPHPLHIPKAAIGGDLLQRHVLKHKAAGMFHSDFLNELRWGFIRVAFEMAA